MSSIITKTAAMSFLIVLLPAVAFGQGFGEIGAFEGTVTGSDLISGIRLVVNGFLSLIAMIAVIMMVIGGLKYITSQGDEDAATAAKNTILYAIVGLVVIGFSAVVVNFVISTFT
jgi:hypothetical protein